MTSITRRDALMGALTPRELRHLREAAGDYEYRASISENGGSPSNAHKFKGRAFAIRKTLRREAQP